MRNPCLIARSPTHEAQRTVVVYGVSRGGTSLAAGVCKGLGVPMNRRDERQDPNHEDPAFKFSDPDRLSEAIRKRNASSDVWGFKWPDALLNKDILEKLLRNPHYIFVYRNIAAVADSVVEKGRGQAPGAVHRATKYYALMDELLNKTDRPVLLLNYEAALEAPDKTIAQIAEFVGLPVSEKAREMIGSGDKYVFSTGRQADWHELTSKR